MLAQAGGLRTEADVTEQRDKFGSNTLTIPSPSFVQILKPVVWSREMTRHPRADDDVDMERY